MITESRLEHTDVRSTANPFPGLRPFEYHENYLFFGREGQSEEMAIRLDDTHFLAVVGTSGSGKSSLVRAGLWPALRGDLMENAGSVWRIVVMRPGNNPIANLAMALNHPVAVRPQGPEQPHIQTTETIQTEITLRRGSLGLIEAVRQAHLKPDENLLIVVDQFEELFRFAQISKDERFANDAAAFVKLLLEAKRQPSTYIVLTMRSEYLGDCAQFLDLPEAINQSQYLIPRMTREQRREAITKPVAVRGASISPALINQLMLDMGDGSNQLPLLQHALMRIWEEWLEQGDKNASLDLRHYENCGGLDETLSRHADEAYKELPDEHSRWIAEKLFKCLTEKGDDNNETRRPTELREICAIADASEEKVIEVINAFRREGRSFLMPSENVSLQSDSSLDISHESLINGWRQLKSWVEEEAESGRIYRRLVEYAISFRRRQKGELRDPWLQDTLDWRDKNRPNRAWACRHHKRFYDPPNATHTVKQALDKEIFDSAIAFLNESERARDKAKEAEETAKREKEERRRKEVRRARQFSAVLAVAVIIAVGLLLTIWLRLRDRNVFVDRIHQMSLQTYRTTMDLAQQALNDRKWGETNQFLNSLPMPGSEDLRGLEWAYLWRASHDEKQTLRGHSGEISSVAFSPDGHTIATASEDRTVRLWDARTYTMIRELRGHRSPVLSLSFAPDGTVLATGSADGTVRLWDTKTGQEKGSPRSARDISAVVRSLAFARQSNKLAIGKNDGTVQVWDIPAQKTIEFPKEHSQYVSSVAFDPDGITIISGSADGTVKLWSADTGKYIGTLVQDPLVDGGGEILSVAVAPDSKTIAAATQKGVINLWDKHSGKVKARMVPRGPSAALSLTFVNNEILITGNADATVKLWNISTAGTPIESGQERQTRSLNHGRRATSELATLKGHSKRISAIAVSPDAKTVITGSADTTAKLWSIDSASETSTLAGHSNRAPIAFSPRPEDKLMARGSDDGTIQLWDSNTKESRLLRGPSQAPVSAVAFSPDGRKLAGGSSDATVTLWDVATSQLTSTLPAHTQEVSALAFSPDGRTLATGSGDTKVKLWDISAATVREIKTLPEGHKKRVTSVAFSVDNSLLATASEDNSIKLWDVATGREKKTLLGHSGEVWSVTFSRDGKLLASGSADMTAMLWDTQNWQVLTTLAHNSGVVSVAFSRDKTNQRLVTASTEGSLKFWDTNSRSEEPIRRQVLATLWSDAGQDQRPIGLRSLALSSDGRILASTRDDGLVELWKAALPEEVARQRQKPEE